MHYSDHILILKIGSGKRREENAALRQIREQSFEMICIWICRNNGERVDAEDIFQEVCINLVEKIRHNKYEHRAKLTTYNFKVAQNLWYKKLRKLGHASLDLPYHNLESDINMEQDLIINNCNTTLYGYINQLPKNERAVIRLYYFEGKKMAEIAPILGFKSAQVAKNVKCKAVKKLSVLMKGLNDMLYTSTFSTSKHSL